MRALLLVSAAVVLLLAGTGQATAADLADRDGDRVFDDLERRLGQTPAGVAVDVIVTLDARATPERVASLAGAVGPFDVARRFTLIDGFATELTRVEIHALARLPGVAHIEADLPVNARNNSAQDSFGVTKARFDSGLDGDGDGSPATYSSADLVAAVLDSGIDANHQDLDEGKVLAYVDCLSGVCVSTAPSDSNGHGTHVAATIAGDGDARADRLYRGVAPAAALVGVRVLDASGNGTMSTVLAALQWVVANRTRYGIEAVNLSLGAAGCFNGADAASAAVNRATTAGLAVVVAAGNEGPGACTVGLPAAAAGAITVGAMGDLGERGFRLAHFSSRGPTLDGRVKPDVVAPGIAIASAAANSPTGYAPYSGTSMAAPFVAGVALLMLDANPALVPSQLKAGMTSTAIDWGAAGPDGEYGAGRLDAYAAIRAVGAPIGAPPVVPVHSFREGAVSVGGSVDVPITVQESGYPFAAAVVAPNWSTGTQGPDFDLALLDASGGLVASAATPPVTGWPDRRRHEELALARLAPGSYTLRVRSVNGAGGFLLDVSGGGIGPPSGSPPPPPSVPPAAPTVVVTPSISGAAREGVTLTAADGTWNAGGPIAFSRQWHRCDRSGAICADIAGATTRTYALGRLDVGSTVRVAVSATAGGGTASAVSASTAVVVRGDDEAPVVRAIASSGRRGRTVKLFYRVSEASGKTSERVRVYRRGRVLRALATPIARREAGRSHYVYWRAPRRPMRLRFCVRAWDAARNASALSCAPLRIR